MTALSLSTWAQAGAAAGAGPQLESIRGAKEVEIVSPQGSRQARIGEYLQPGDRVTTGKGVVVRLVYPDRTRLVVGESSQAEILAPQKGTEWSRLHSGKVRALVPKTRGSAQGPQKTDKKYRFATRTRAAVMGVRGTDYQVEAESGDSASLTTFDGEVDLAQIDPQKPEQDPLGELAAQATSVKAGMTARFSAGKIDRIPLKGEELQKKKGELGEILHMKLKSSQELQQELRGGLSEKTEQTRKQLPSVPSATGQTYPVPAKKLLGR